MEGIVMYSRQEQLLYKKVRKLEIWNHLIQRKSEIKINNFSKTKRKFINISKD